MSYRTSFFRAVFSGEGEDWPQESMKLLQIKNGGKAWIIL